MRLLPFFALHALSTPRPIMVAALAISALTLACDRNGDGNGPRSCTEMGCSSALELTSDAVGASLDGTQIEVVLDGSIHTYVCNPSDDDVNAGIRYMDSCDADNVTLPEFEFGDFDSLQSVRVLDVDGNVVAEFGSDALSAETFRPNGDGCEPECTTWTVQ